MSVIRSRWRKQQSRPEDGIYFPSDDFIELCGTPKKGYTTDLRAPLSTLLREDSNAWSDLDEMCSATAGDFIVKAGGTSEDGAGFVSVAQGGGERLLWLLHLSKSEQFTEVTCDGKTIHAISEENTRRYEWQIPIQHPDNLKVSAIS